MNKYIIILTLIVPINFLAYSEYIWVDFYKSMEQTDRFDRKEAQKQFIWQQAQKQYNAHVLYGKPSEDLLIPKIIHHVWLGSPLPEKCQRLRETWQKYHPGWKLMLWTDKEVAQLNLVNKKSYEKAQNWGEKSDIVRYEVLYRFGGLYVDTDFECLKPFDVLHHSCEFYAGINCLTQFGIFNGMIGSRPGHPILKFCIDEIKNHENDYQRWNLKGYHGTAVRTGTSLFTKHIVDHLQDCTDKAVLFPTSYFYPWAYVYSQEKNSSIIEQWIKPESFAIHHWHCSWMKKK